MACLSSSLYLIPNPLLSLTHPCAQPSARWIGAESQPQRERSAALGSSRARGHQGHTDTQGPPRLLMKHKGPLQPKGAWFSRGLFSMHFLTAYILWVILTFGCTLCPHRKVGNAILNSSSLCQSVQPDTAKECTRPTFWGFLKYPFLWQ